MNRLQTSSRHEHLASPLDRKSGNSSGVYICKSIIIYLRRGTFICKPEGIYQTVKFRYFSKRIIFASIARNGRQSHVEFIEWSKNLWDLYVFWYCTCRVERPVKTSPLSDRQREYSSNQLRQSRNMSLCRQTPSCRCYGRWRRGRAY